VTRARAFADASDRRARVDEAVPVGVRIAGAWAWRLLVIAGVVAIFVFLVVQLRLIVIPLMVAVLLAALLVPFVTFLQRHRWPKWLAITVAEVGILAIVSALVYLVVAQVRDGFPALQERTVVAIDTFREFLRDSPLHLTDTQIGDFLGQAFESIQANSGVFVTGALSVGSTAGHVLIGILLVLFANLILLIDGEGIWGWVVRLFPRNARAAVNGSGIAGWTTLTRFVRVQVFVAAVDAVGIGGIALILQLPLAIPIAVAVFLGSFIPIVGAVLTGTIAVFIALVYQGPVIALIMLAGVLLVQQIEGHVLQPLVMGAVVKVHPLAVVLAVGAGGFLAGIPGALFAVPIVATVNSIAAYMASGAWRESPYPDPNAKDVTRNA